MHVYNISFNSMKCVLFIKACISNWSNVAEMPHHKNLGINRTK